MLGCQMGCVSFASLIKLSGLFHRHYQGLPRSLSTSLPGLANNTTFNNKFMLSIRVFYLWQLTAFWIETVFTFLPKTERLSNNLYLIECVSRQDCLRLIFCELHLIGYQHVVIRIVNSWARSQLLCCILSGIQILKYNGNCTLMPGSVAVLHMS